MRNRQVPRAEWFLFFRGFSKRHEDSLVTVRVLHPTFGSQIEASGLPLEGVVSDPKGEGPIAIHVGRNPAAHVEHEVERPIRVWVELSENGAEEAVDIESTDGTKTIIQLRSTAAPEAVNGLLPS